MITIKSKPYTTLPINLNGVYNGLPFVLDSEQIKAPNFKYICEVYYNNQKVTELRHHPDISYAKKGVFEVGRILENYMTFNQSVLKKFASFPGNDAVNKYHCNFGEEYSRIMKFTSYNNVGGRLRLQGEWTVQNQTGDWMYVQGSTIPSYNGWKKIYQKLGSQTVTLDVPYVGQPNVTGGMYAYQGTNVTAFLPQTLNGTEYLAIKIPIPTGSSPILYNVGDRVYIEANGLPQFYRNTEWSVLKGPYKPTATSTFLLVILSAPYKFPVNAWSTGGVYSKDNFVLKNQISTSVDNSYAWTGVRQYNQEYLNDITSTPADNIWQYAFKKQTINPQGFMKTFSDKPTKVVSICPNEVYQVQSMGSWLNKVGSSDLKKETHIRIETWGTNTHSYSGGLVVQSGGIAQAGNTLTYRHNGNVLSEFGVGDYVDITPLGHPTVSCRIVRVQFTGGFTYIYTDGVGPNTGIGSIISTIRVQYTDVQLQTGSQVIPCGPWNLSALVGFYYVYKYFVYPIVPTAGTYFTPSGGLSTGSDNNGVNYTGTRPQCGEKWEFNIDTSCCSDMPTYKIMWLNKQGGFDFYKFDKRSDRKFNIERSEFERKLPNIQMTTNIYGYKSGGRGTTNYNVKSRETLIVNSEFLTQLELDWLINIYESPEVYIVKDGPSVLLNGTPNPHLIPVSVISNEVFQPNKKFRQDNGSSLYTYQLEIQMATDRVIQRGAPMSYNYVDSTQTGGGTGTWTPDNWARPDRWNQEAMFYTKSLYE